MLLTTKFTSIFTPKNELLVGVVLQAFCRHLQWPTLVFIVFCNVFVQEWYFISHHFIFGVLMEILLLTISLDCRHYSLLLRNPQQYPSILILLSSLGTITYPWTMLRHTWNLIHVGHRGDRVSGYLISLVSIRIRGLRTLSRGSLSVHYKLWKVAAICSMQVQVLVSLRNCFDLRN